MNQNTNELADTIFQVFRLLKGQMSFNNDITYLSILQMHALIFLHHNESVSMSDIASHFKIELPSATSLVEKLHKKDLIVRSEDKNDRRLVVISLSEEGKKLVKQAMADRRKKLENMLNFFTDKERSELLNILKKLYTRLQEKNE